ncbi:hypothetical protein [Haloarcula salinisoli]|uniref:Beta-galactosidase n=1 Tax=Haloarcula salinisoli TaxID=2487746 RepID=A0A8J7YIC1_9EURY|nr:hypothetical protein [Halomicroarcula salinisoli]MBX0288603.1 hypothetical protein [Halomicroarcula salinisoli]MBX0306017.1 hypothetical protein [Halomicroarcula salinisoli]
MEQQQYTKAVLSPEQTSDITHLDRSVPLDTGEWYQTGDDNGRLVYDIPQGTLSKEDCLSFDVLQTGEHASVFELLFTDGSQSLLSRVPELIWSKSDDQFVMNIRTLPECSARVRIPLNELTKHQVKRSRDGAWLNSFLGGQKVDPGDVERIILRVKETRGDGTSWCQSPLVITRESPPPVEEPALHTEELLDEFGQSAVHSHPRKFTDEQAMTDHLQSRLDRVANAKWPSSFSSWGGWTTQSYEGTGYFRTTTDGDRWWLVDPDGHPFWSTGVSTVRPVIESAYDGLENALSWLPDTDRFTDAHVDTETPVQETHEENRDDSAFNYLGANLIRAFGPDSWRSSWRELAIGELVASGFNTIGAWSETQLGRELEFPYTRILEYEFDDIPTICSDFPDVFHSDFEAVVDEYAAPLAETADDPYMLGYFLCNYPDWTLLERPVAAEMLSTPGECPARDALADRLRDQYGTNQSLRRAWETDVSFDDIRAGSTVEVSSSDAMADLEAFSRTLVGRFASTLASACERYDSNHLNLGIRFAEAPPSWAEPCVEHADVFTVYSYSSHLDESSSADRYETLSQRYDVPVLIGEWQFGSLDAPLPSPGLCAVPDQSARGRAVRRYLEGAASKPWCVGTHYFRFYDHSAVGGRHGENFNIGLFDTCHQSYAPVTDAFRASNERLYAVAADQATPYEESHDSAD